MEEEVLKYLDFEGLSLYHQNIQTEFDQKVDKVDFYNDEKIIASALNDLNTRKVNNDDLANVATSGNYNDLNNKPTKVSEFTNDAGYVTELDISGKADQSDLEDLEEEVINNEEVIANALSILSDRIEDNEKVTASALTDLLEKKYEKPSGGIPSSDLAQAVQNLLTAAGTALQASDLNTLNSKVQTLETYFSNEADTDTIINKWNEIVTFLAGISESNTLNDIISNISGHYKNLPHSYVSAVGEQNFTDAQQAMARKNIGAASQEDMVSVKKQLDAINPKVDNDYYVDMGLPSGLLWAKRNLDVTQPDGFAASEYQYECSFVSWGNTDMHNPADASSFSYDWGSGNDGPYASTPGAALTANIAPSMDAARVNLGAPWRMPTTEEFAELFNYCDFVQADGSTVIDSGTYRKLVTVNGIKGIYLKSKINGRLLFFACSGRGGYGSSWKYRGSDGNYWSSSLHSATKGRRLFFFSIDVGPQDNFDRFVGFAVRPVM